MYGQFAYGLITMRREFETDQFAPMRIHVSRSDLPDACIGDEHIVNGSLFSRELCVVTLVTPEIVELTAKSQHGKGTP